MMAVFDEAEPREVIARDHLSWSALTCYRTCPLKYYFRYVARLPEQTTSASLLFGGAIHRALASYFTACLQGPSLPGLDRLLEEYQIHWIGQAPSSKPWDGNDSQAALLSTAKRMLAAFLASPLARPCGQILAVEERLSGRLLKDAPPLVGVVDLLLITAGELILIDWKTSRARWSELQLAEAEEQLLLYGQLACELVPGKRIRLQPVVLTKTKAPVVESYPLAFDRRRLQRTITWMGAIWRAIEDEHFYPTPSALACSGCSFRENCQAWNGPVAD